MQNLKPKSASNIWGVILRVRDMGIPELQMTSALIPKILLAENINLPRITEAIRSEKAKKRQKTMNKFLRALN